VRGEERRGEERRGEERRVRGGYCIINYLIVIILTYPSP
jgi:hypothetical protein